MQSRRHSLLEALASTAIGFLVALAANITILKLMGFEATFAQNLWMTLFFTIVSIIRGYGVRRLFNWMHKEGIL